ncbi:MAG: carboxypeptidase regulatory-like domain-containing protein [Gemmatimonadota bacterium]
MTGMRNRVLLLMTLSLPAAVAQRAPQAPQAPPAPLAKTECRTGDAGRAHTRALWHPMRTALVSVERTRIEALEPLAISRYERLLSRSGGLVSESKAGSATLGSRPFRTASGAELSRNGFVVMDSVGLAVFRAPDAEVLLSDEFASDHCLDVVTGSGVTAGMIGLSFAPAPNRKVTDVQGVLWADIETSLLRFAEFSYWFPAPTEVRDAGGRIRFEQLGSFNWIAREWVLRTPVLTQRGQLLGYREEGGGAMTVTPRMRFVMDSVENSRKVPGIITGIVTDSLTGTGFAGARVWIDSAGPTARTDAKGLYFLRGVPPGEHLVRFTHPMLDSIGIQPRGVMVEVRSESMVDANLGGPSFGTLVGETCGDSLAVTTGVVRDASTGEPVDSANVTLSWIELKLGKDRRPVLIAPREATASTDITGRYGACVMPDVEVTGLAQRGAARTARIDVLTAERRLAILDFALDLTADSLRGSAELQGVVKYQDGMPLRNAIVTLSDPEMSVTPDTAGRFRIRAVPGGTRTIDARALGHAPQRVRVDAKPGATSDVSIYMRKVTMLDPVLVRAAADDRTAETLAAMAGRQRRRQGTRVTQSQMRAFRDSRLDAVFRSLSYARLETSPALNLALRDTRGRECRPTVWLDGRRSDISIVVQLSARDVMALEVMRTRGDVPAEYQDFADCGAVLVWMNPLR